MNDYLSTIASRAARPETTLRPMKAPAFASARVQDALPVEDASRKTTSGGADRRETLSALHDAPWRLDQVTRVPDSPAHPGSPAHVDAARSPGPTPFAEGLPSVAMSSSAERLSDVEARPIAVPSTTITSADAPLDAMLPGGAVRPVGRSEEGAIGRETRDAGGAHLGGSPEAARAVGRSVVPFDRSIHTDAPARPVSVRPVLLGRSLEDSVAGPRAMESGEDAAAVGARDRAVAGDLPGRADGASLSAGLPVPLSIERPTGVELPAGVEPSMRARAGESPAFALRPAVLIRAAIEPARAARSEPTTAPTVVHVTIGRIDVRAVAPPPAPRPQPSAARSASPMSLEEYLSGKTRGAR